MVKINYNLKVRRKNMRCTKFECDMAKAFAGAFKEIVEDNKRMKDALILFSHYLNGNFEWTIPLDCNDDMVNELIKITTNEEGKQLVSARELHEFLGLQKRFSAWIEQYIKEDNEYMFINGEDFTSVLSSTVVNNGANRELQDYAITISMAKEISMVTKNEKGKEARKYFIKMEKKAKNPYSQLSKELQAIFVLDERTQRLEEEIKEVKNDLPLFNIDCEQLQNAVRRKGIELLGGKNSSAYQDRSTRTKVYLDIQSTIKRNFGITSYKALKRKQLDKAIELVNEYKLPIILEDKINELNNQISF